MTYRDTKMTYIHCHFFNFQVFYYTKFDEVINRDEVNRREVCECDG
jgi:hypothetical protein